MARLSKPGTIEHFREWAADLVLPTGETWELEDWRHPSKTPT